MINKEIVINKCNELKLEYVTHEFKVFNGKEKWVITYSCNIHGDIETSWDHFKKMKACKECNKEKRWGCSNKKCDFCDKTSSEEKIVRTYKFGKEQFFCLTHYYQMERTGEIKRTKYWKNEIIEYDDYIEIVLYDRHQNTTGKSKVSKHHREVVEQYKWYRKVYPNRYTDYVLSTDENGNSIRLHVLITRIVLGEKPKGMTVDHKNRDGLDNRDENLSYKDQTHQNYNQKLHKNNKSGVRGVSVFAEKYWASQMSYKGIKLHRVFKDFDKAVEKRRYWEKLIEEGRIDLLEKEKEV